MIQGIEGTLERKKSGLQFVLTLALIDRRASVDIDAEELEPIPNQRWN